MVRGAAEVGRLEAGLTGGAHRGHRPRVCLLLPRRRHAQVYEEAEMWGAALALCAFYALVGFLDRPSGGRLLATGVLTTLALLTRGSVGAGPLVAIGLAWRGVRCSSAWRSRAPRWRSLARRVMPGVRRPGGGGTGPPRRRPAGGAGIPIALYVAINEIKFDTLFSIPLNHQVLSLEIAHRQAVLAANGGSLFGLKFLPTNLLQFARPDALALSRRSPGSSSRAKPWCSATSSIHEGLDLERPGQHARALPAGRGGCHRRVPPHRSSRGSPPAGRNGDGGRAIGPIAGCRTALPAGGCRGRYGRHLDHRLHRRALSG